MKKHTIALLIILVLLAGCGQEGDSTDVKNDISYMSISAEEAKTIMDTVDDYHLVDVRTQEEFDSGYIPGALLIPHTSIQEMAPDLLPDLNQKILVYCRSGSRSKAASKALVNMGYTDVLDMGGINDWDYDIVKD
ncbi:MAG: rhodanese-like domain-containing protein [Firmicutes bacterium HGW-Firmicutes-3]|jgi:rhodanese-related sulfurtransferase|nr:MAG: rhodanese-like domain-containing protein [Firmicutes bacterium HGW-Firmicutes-3]